MAVNAPQGKGAAAPSDLVLKAGGITKLVEEYAGDFGRVVPRHIRVEAFMQLAIAYVRRDKALREAAEVNPASLILALRECAALGHVPVPKTYALTAFRSKDATGGWAIVGIETYHGVIERMYRAGGVQAVKCDLVRATDNFGWDAVNQRVTHHSYDPMADDKTRGELAGVYAYAVLHLGGISRMCWLNRSEVMKHRAVAKTDKFWTGPWEPDMWRKTAVHALETWVPTSAEYRWEAAASASAAASGFTGIPDLPAVDYSRSPDDIQDAELIDEPAPIAQAASTQRASREGPPGAERAQPSTPTPEPGATAQAAAWGDVNVRRPPTPDEVELTDAGREALKVKET